MTSSAKCPGCIAKTEIVQVEEVLKREGGEIAGLKECVLGVKD